MDGEGRRERRGRESDRRAHAAVVAEDLEIEARAALRLGHPFEPPAAGHEETEESASDRRERDPGLMGKQDERERDLRDAGHRVVAEVHEMGPLGDAAAPRNEAVKATAQ